MDKEQKIIVIVLLFCVCGNYICMAQNNNYISGNEYAYRLYNKLDSISSRTVYTTQPSIKLFEYSFSYYNKSSRLERERRNRIQDFISKFFIFEDDTTSIQCRDKDDLIDFISFDQNNYTICIRDTSLVEKSITILFRITGSGILRKEALVFKHLANTYLLSCVFIKPTHYSIDNLNTDEWGLDYERIMEFL